MDLINRANKINFDMLIKKDFDSIERGKKTLLMFIDPINIKDNPYYYLNKAIMLYYIQQRRAKEYIIHSRSLLNVKHFILLIFYLFIFKVSVSCL